VGVSSNIVVKQSLGETRLGGVGLYRGTFGA
jgi:hypothetical protein